MKPRSLAVAFLAVALLAALPVFAQKPKAEAFKAKVPAIKKLVTELMEQEKLNAVLLAVNAGGEDVLILAEGESMTGVPAMADMHYRIGAVSIAYMGNILLQLADEGKVKLDDPVSKWMPDLPNADGVTLEMLINGTSGYPDYVPDKKFQEAFYADPFRQFTPQELMDFAFDSKPKFDPGAGWNYAHTNFVILGEVLAKAAKKPFGEIMQERILKKWGLANTANPDTAAIPQPVLHAFTAERGKYEESTFWNPSWTLARGAVMTSTLKDQVASARAFGRGKSLKPESFSLMIEPKTAGFKPWNPNRYFGLGVVAVDGWLMQNPLFCGYSGVTAYQPDGDIAIAICVTTKDGAKADTNFANILFSKLTHLLTPSHAVQLGK